MRQQDPGTDWRVRARAAGLAVSLGIASLALALLAIRPGVAAAGTYTVHACQTPAGATADVDWSLYWNHGAKISQDDCPQGALFGFDATPGVDDALEAVLDEFIGVEAQATARSRERAAAVVLIMRFSFCFSHTVISARG